MGIQNTAAEDTVALFDSVSGVAFGPVFDSEDEAEDFLNFCELEGHDDIRQLAEGTLMELHIKWQDKINQEIANA